MLGTQDWLGRQVLKPQGASDALGEGARTMFLGGGEGGMVALLLEVGSSATPPPETERELGDGPRGLNNPEALRPAAGEVALLGAACSKMPGGVMG